MRCLLACLRKHAVQCKRRIACADLEYLDQGVDQLVEWRLSWGARPQYIAQQILQPMRDCCPRTLEAARQRRTGSAQADIAYMIPRCTHWCGKRLCTCCSCMGRCGVTPLKWWL